MADALDDLLTAQAATSEGDGLDALLSARAASETSSATSRSRTPTTKELTDLRRGMNRIDRCPGTSAPQPASLIPSWAPGS